MFETLVLAEIVKFIRNYRKDWELFFWRTKDGDEIDFLLKTGQQTFHIFEAKLSFQGRPQEISMPKSINKSLTVKHPLVVVTFGGKKILLSKLCLALPIASLHDYLMDL